MFENKLKTKKMSANSFATLTHREETIYLPLLIQMLEHRTTSKKVFSNTHIRKTFESFGHDIDDSKIRKLIFHIRNNDLIDLLIADGKGYYISYNKNEIENWLIRQKGKISAMESTIKSIEKQLKRNMKKVTSTDSNGMEGQIGMFEDVD